MDYANRFTCLLNGAGTEFILSFAQDKPVVDDAGELSRRETVDIASIVMTADLAKTLQEHIAQLLQQPPQQS